MDIDAGTVRGMTALHYAAKVGSGRTDRTPFSSISISVLQRRAVRVQHLPCLVAFGQDALQVDLTICELRHGLEDLLLLRAVQVSALLKALRDCSMFASHCRMALGMSQTVKRVRRHIFCCFFVMIQANRTAVIRELARLGADLEARNDCGQVPAQLTKDRLVSTRRGRAIVSKLDDTAKR